MELHDKVIAVTGTGGAFAREIVLGLLAQGARVAAIDHREANLADTAARADAGERLSTHVAPLSDRATIETLPAAIISAHGTIDALVHVGGSIHPPTPLTELPVEAIEEVLANNLLGTVYLNKAFLPHLLARPEATLVNFSHASALAPNPDLGGYSTSKGGVRTWSETLALELADSPVTVVTVYPGEIGPAAPATTPGEAAAATIEALAAGNPRAYIGDDARDLAQRAREL